MRWRRRDRTPVIVLGVDPGTAVTGYGVVASDGTSQRLVECGVIRTRPRDPLAHRLKEIYDGIAELVARHLPQAIAIEDVFFAKNVRTTVVLGHARGVVLLCGAQAGIDIFEYPPAVIKKAVVGSGNASKLQVQFMVTQILRLKSPPHPADAADGVAAALAHALTARVSQRISAAAASDRSKDVERALAAMTAR